MQFGWFITHFIYESKNAAIFWKWKSISVNPFSFKLWNRFTSIGNNMKAFHKCLTHGGGLELTVEGTLDSWPVCLFVSLSVDFCVLFHPSLVPSCWVLPRRYWWRKARKMTRPSIRLLRGGWEKRCVDEVSELSVRVQIMWNHQRVLHYRHSVYSGQWS